MTTTEPLDYRALHWGEEPTRNFGARIFDYATQPVESLGFMRAISYATSKGSRRAVWRHAIERPVRLLRASPGGRRWRSHHSVPRELAVIGVLVDIELGRGLWLPSGDTVFIATDPHGSSIWLASPGGVQVQVEQRARGLYVTPDGIQG